MYVFYTYVSSLDEPRALGANVKIKYVKTTTTTTTTTTKIRGDEDPTVPGEVR